MPDNQHDPATWVRITPLGVDPCDTRRCEVPGCDRVFTHQVAFDSPDERNRVNVGSLMQARWRTFPERRCVLVCEDHEPTVAYSDAGVLALSRPVEETTR